MMEVCFNSLSSEITYGLSLSPHLRYKLHFKMKNNTIQITISSSLSNFKIWMESRHLLLLMFLI